MTMADFDNKDIETNCDVDVTVPDMQEADIYRDINKPESAKTSLN